MDYLGDVSTEGGPFLIVDRLAFGSWRGAGDGTTALESTDYAMILAIYEGQLAIAGRSAVAFDIAGPGTASVFRAGTGEIVIASAFVDSDDDWAHRQRATARKWRAISDVLGHVDVPSGDVVIIWSPVDSRDVNPFPAGVDATRLDANAIVGLGIQVTVEPGRYVVRAGETELDGHAGICAVVMPA